jgi:hypothetical protein
MFSRKEKSFAKAIELEQWQDPVEDVAAVFSEEVCNVYFFVRDSELIGKLSFDRATAFRSVRTEVAPHMDSESKFSSYILEVFHSPRPGDIEFGFYTEQAREFLRKKRHFLVKGHDIYHEVLCLDFSESYLSKEDDEYSYAQKVLGH